MTRTKLYYILGGFKTKEGGTLIQILDPKSNTKTKWLACEGDIWDDKYVTTLDSEDVHNSRIVACQLDMELSPNFKPIVKSIDIMDTIENEEE